MGSYGSRPVQWFLLSLCSGSLAVLMAGCGSSLGTGGISSGGGFPASQSHPVAGPMLGYAWDPAAHVLRGINGVPGAAVLTTAGNTGAGFITARASYTQSYALLLGSGSSSSTAKAGSLYLATLPGGAPRLVAQGQWTGIALSASGSYALVYSTLSQTAAIVTGLPQQPTLRTLELTGTPQLTAGVISDTGAALIATAGDSTNSVALYAVSTSGSISRASKLGSLGGIAFVPATDTALAADASTGAIQKISTVGSAPIATTLSLSGGTSSGIAQAVGIDVTSDARYAVVANAAGKFLRIDLTGQTAPAYAKCNCAPETVTALTGSAVRFTTPGSGPVWILDAAAATPKSVFIPAPNAKTNGGGM